MNKTRALIAAMLTLMATWIAGCSGSVRYTNGKQNLQLQLQPADKAAEMIE